MQVLERDPLYKKKSGIGASLVVLFVCVIYIKTQENVTMVFIFFFPNKT